MFKMHHIVLRMSYKYMLLLSTGSFIMYLFYLDHKNLVSLLLIAKYSYKQ